MTRSLPIALAAAACLVAGGSRGIRPRAAVVDYPAHESAGIAAFGAAVIPSGEVKKIFAADLDRAGYIVIEVGVFPDNGRGVDLSPLDFTLLTDPNAISERAAEPDTVAAVAIKPRGSGSETNSDEVSVTAGASVQHTSYPDPLTGRRTGTTTTDVGTGVGVAPLPPQAAGSDPGNDRLERRLFEKSLPDGKTTIAVAGYPYFPKPSKKTKNAAWELQWENAGGRVKIPLPSPSR